MAEAAATHPEFCVAKVASFPIHGIAVSCVAGVGRGRFASGHPNGDIRLWTADGELEATLHGHSLSVTALVDCPSGSFVSASNDATVKVWDGRACVLTCSGHVGEVWAVAVSSLDGTIVSGSFDCTAKVWGGSTGGCVATLKGHSSSVTAVCVLTEGTVVTGSRDKTVRMWGRESWRSHHLHSLPSDVKSLASLPGGRFVVGCGSVWGTPSSFSVRSAAGCLWSTTTPASLISVHASLAGWLAVRTMHTLTIVRAIDGVAIDSVRAEAGCACAVFGKGHLAVESWRREVVTVFGTVKRSRLDTIRVMVAAWSVYGGTPPPHASKQRQAAALAHTLSLRRLCRPRGGGAAAALEIVEPFAMDVVGYM